MSNLLTEKPKASSVMDLLVLQNSITEDNNMKKQLLLILAVLVISISNMEMINAESNTEFFYSDEQSYSKDDYIELFQSAGVDVPIDATFKPTTAKTEDGRTIEIAEMITESNDSIKTTFLLQYEVRGGKDVLLDYRDAIKNNKAVNSIPFTCTRFSITATARYNRTTYDGSYYYKPLSLSAISSITQTIKVNYHIVGWKKIDTPEIGGHEIHVNQYPATANQYYSTNYNASYYYKPLVQAHYIEFETNSSSTTVGVTND